MEKEDYRTKGYSSVDRFVHSHQARFTMSMSPVTVMLAYLDWALNFSNSPGKQMQLAEKYFLKTRRLAAIIMQSVTTPDCPLCVDTDPQDHRFQSEEWRQWPYSLFFQLFLLTEKWWQSATTDVPGVSKHVRDVVSFLTRQWLDIFAPSNFVPTNPVISRITIEKSGANLVQGWHNFIDDFHRFLANQKPVGTEDFKVGVNIGVTPARLFCATSS